jgi:hypothetical protein
VTLVGLRTRPRRTPPRPAAGLSGVGSSSHPLRNPSVPVAADEKDYRSHRQGRVPDGVAAIRPLAAEVRRYLRGRSGIDVVDQRALVGRDADLPDLYRATALTPPVPGKVDAPEPGPISNT